MEKFIEFFGKERLVDLGSYFDCFKVIHCYNNNEFVMEYMTNRGFISQRYHTVFIENRNGKFRFFESITPEDFNWGNTPTYKVRGEEYHELTLDFLSFEKDRKIERLQNRLDKAEAKIVSLKRK